MAGGFFWEEADVVDVAVVFGEVHTVADDELVGDFKAYIVGLDGDEAAVGFVEAGCDLEGRGLVLEHEATEIAQGEAGVEDVFDDDDVLALNRIVDVFDEFDGAGGDASAAVARDGDEVEGGVDGDGAREIGEKDGGAFEDAYEDDGLSGVVGGDLLAECLDAVGDLGFGVEDRHSGGGGKDRCAGWCTCWHKG